MRSLLIVCALMGSPAAASDLCGPARDFFLAQGQASIAVIGEIRSQRMDAEVATKLRPDIFPPVYGDGIADFADALMPHLQKQSEAAEAFGAILREHCR